MAPILHELGLDRLDARRPEALWESVAEDAAAAPLPPAQRAELERRLADSIARPDAVTNWETIRTRALARA
ncbi:MAG: addiction module protein [Fimbriiglobus sp.]